MAVSRAYYACLYATIAALAACGIHRSTHGRTRAAFSQFLIKPGLIETEYGRILARLQTSREEADDSQDAADTDVASATVLVADAERFVRRVEQDLRGIGAID